MNSITFNTDHRPRFEITIPSVMSLLGNRPSLKNSQHSSRNLGFESPLGNIGSQRRVLHPIKILSLHLPRIYNNSSNNSPVRACRPVERFKKSKAVIEYERDKERDDDLDRYFIPKFYFSKKNNISPVRREELRRNSVNHHVKIMNSFLK